MFAAIIIREAGLSPQDFPNASQIPVKLFDRKDRVIEDEDIHFVEPIFAKNPKSKDSFENLLHTLEEARPEMVSLRIDENYLFLLQNGHCTKIYSRLPPIDLMDILDFD